MNLQSIKSNKWVRRVAWTAAGVVVLWGIGWLAVPPIVKSQAQKIASEQLGRKVTIGAVDFKPWTLELTLTDLAVATADGAGQQLHVQRLYVDGELQSILRLAPVVDAVAVDAPSLKLTRLSQGHYDIDDILARLSQPSSKPPGKPLHFALYNLALHGGSVDFTDKAVGKTQQLRDLTLSVPFLSNLDSKRDVVVQPRLAFTLNGSHFDSAAEGTPFAQTHKLDATIKLAGFDLAPYLGYIPASLPVRLQTGVIDTDLRVAFEQTATASVKLSGTVQASHVKLTDAKTQDLLAFDALKLTLADVQPLVQRANIASVELTGPSVAVRRDPAGRLNLDLAATPAAVSTTPAATKNGARSEDATGAEATKKAEANAWKIQVDKVAVRGGTVAWTDETTAPHARLALHDLVFDAAAIALPFAKPLQFSGSAVLAPATAPTAASTAAAPASEAPQAASLSFGGAATDRMVSVAANVKALPLSLAAPYLASFIEPGLNGQLTAQLNADWKAPAAGAQASGLLVGVKQLTLENLALTDGNAVSQPRARSPRNAALPSIKQIDVTDAQIDLDNQTVSVGKLVVTDPHASVERGADKRWMFERWLKQPAASGASRGSASKRPVAPAKPWQVAINEVAVEGGTVSYRDAAMPRPVALEVSKLALQLKDFALDGKKPSPLTVSARVGAGRTEPGRLEYHGDLGLNPLSAQGQVQAVRLPLHALEPYFGDALNIRLLRADASFKGQVHYLKSKAGPVVKVTGDSALEDFRANSVLPPGVAVAAATSPASAGAAPKATAVAVAGSLQPVIEPLLQWKALSVRGLDLTMKPGTATRVNVRQTALSDFYARVIINPNGRINLQDLVKSSAQPAAAAPASAAAPITPAPAVSPAPAAGGAPAPIVNIGPISLVNGKVLFSDHFIKPNYSADLTELTGKLSAFSSVAPAGAPTMADLELRGKAEGTASLEITGKLNPLAKPLALDITGKVRDLELPPLSPYAIKYAGHGIERGKMSLDVNYVVLPNGQLTAKNNLVLNQLSFGDEVKGAPTSLPVKLAVALLADRNGVINLDLPISGSLNDPQFSLGPIIFKAIINLIVKAVTAPFSLLANAFGGGGNELSTVAFAPGSAVLTPDARQSLDKVAKALAERPALKMTVVGTASLDAEMEGYRRERLNAMVRAEKRRETTMGGSAAPAPAAAAAAPATTVSEAEYPALLKQVYKHADIPKPRNLIGMAKDIPQAEMESLLMANIPVTEDAMRQLALARGEAVKDYLATKQVPAQQLFLGAPKAAADQPATESKPGAKWSPHADLSLATR
ncbi:DUF748 domain-containing protein [Polaromonas sp. C04]|uniref:DUF748 domain-containing protein n=1 Tax=Polaromonas sp. C04 TaxID=1945857 RepID=UPI000986C08D|nr:DUF748 domain-containing protein [Polaromonas sp. C04]OOG55325.1 hypothetical protein B0E49_07610 [Polaromonas sp. C04]